MVRREISPERHVNNKRVKMENGHEGANEEVGALSTERAIWIVGNIPVHVIKSTLSDKEKVRVIKAAKLSLTEATGNQTRAEFIHGELQEAYDEFEWTCSVAHNLGFARSKTSSKPPQFLLLTLGPHTILVTKNDPDPFEVNISNSNMDGEQKEYAIKIAKRARREMGNESDLKISKYIATEFDVIHGHHWSCVFSTEKGIAVQCYPDPYYSKDLYKNYICFTLGNAKILLFQWREEVASLMLREQNNEA